MLHEFLDQHRVNLIERTNVMVARRPAQAKALKAQFGAPLFLTQLTAVLEAEAGANPRQEPDAAISASAGQHGNEMLEMGYSVAQVVRTYGDVCQAVTELAIEKGFAISTHEFHTLNRATDDAIAGAVTEYGRQREAELSAAEAARMGSAFDQRNLLCSGILAWEMIRKGTVGPGGNTGAVLTRCFVGLREINNRSNSGPPIPDIVGMEG